MPLLDFNRTIPYKRKTGTLGFFQILHQNFFDLVLLNLIFTITSIPIFTIGASYSALCAVCIKIYNDEPIYPLKEYFNKFIINFKNGIISGLIYSITLIIIGYSFIFYFNFGKENYIFYYFSVLSLLCFILILLSACYFFPIIVMVKIKIKESLKDAFILAISQIFKTLKFFLVVTIECFLVISLFPYSIPFVFIFPFSILALSSVCCSFSSINNHIILN